MVNYNVGVGPSTRVGHMLQSSGFWDDFLAPSISTSAAVSTWNVENAVVGTVIAAIDEQNGAVNILNVSGGDDASMETNGPGFVWSDTRDALWEIRLKIDATSAVDWFVGLAEPGETAILLIGAASILGCAGFKGENADANIDVQVRVVGGTTETTEDTGTDLVAATYIVLSMKWAAQSQKLHYYIDGVKVLTQSRADGDLIPADGDALCLYMGTSVPASGTGTTMTVDYVAYVSDRD